MVGENTVGMKKLEEITLEDIQNYLRKYDCDGVIANYAQTECQFRYCGTAIPFLTVRSTAR